MSPEARRTVRVPWRVSSIQSNVLGFDIGELRPLQAQIADKRPLARNLKFHPHFLDPVESSSRPRKPSGSGSAALPEFGSVIRKLYNGSAPRELPSTIALDKTAGYEFPARSSWVSTICTATWMPTRV